MIADPLTSPDALTTLLRGLATTVFCFYAPGRALLPRATSQAPAMFARVLVSVMLTTFAATLLAALERFSLANLFVADAVLAASCLVARRWLSRDYAVARGGSAGAALGPLVAVFALAAWWPAYPVFLGAADSSAYVATGVSLANHGTLAREDELGPALPPIVKPGMFDSMSQVVGGSRPPYRRMPGAMLLESLDATRAWPAFFPVPAVWSAVFASIGGVSAAPAYAPCFAALALWAFFLLAEAWLGRAAGLLATALLGASSAFYSSAKMPLSEPIAAFFVLSGLALFVTGSRNPRRNDLLLAGAALGAAVFTRIEIALYLALALAIAGRSGGTRGFFIAMAGFALLGVVQVVMVPGSYADPLTDHLRNIGVLLFMAANEHPALCTGGLLAIATIAVVAVGRFGLTPLLRVAVVLSVVLGHATASNFLYARTPMWLSFSIGWGGLALAALGAVLALRERERLPGARFVLALGTGAAIVLFYNPHVFPALPWGARRFVPLLLPMLVLLACFAASRIAARSRFAAFACVIVLMVGVHAGGRPVWGARPFERGQELLGEVAAAIPADGVPVYDRDISPLMLGPALWLIHDRNGLAVHPTTNTTGRQQLAALTYQFSPAREVYFVTRGVGTPVKTPFVKMTRVASIPVLLPVFEATYDRPPVKIDRYLLPLAVYRLEKTLDGRGVIVDPAAKVTWKGGSGPAAKPSTGRPGRRRPRP